MNRLFWLLALASVPFVVSGCAGVADADGDLLSDNFELAIGTNPEIADSDGDSFTDAQEWLGYYNPTDPDDHPGEGQFVRLPSPSNLPDGELDGDGWSVGDVSNNWTGEDQFGDILDLHDFYGQVILVDVSAEWCNPCRNAAPAAEEEYQANKDTGFVVLNLLLDGLDNPSPPDPERWATELDLTFPVIPDPDTEIATNYIDSPDGSFSIPNFSVLDRNMEIVNLYSVGTADFGAVDDLLEEDLPYVEWPLPENTEELRTELDVNIDEDADVHLATNIELGIELAGSGVANSGGSGDEGGYDGGAVVTPAGADGSYAGAPWGGASCSVSSSPTAGSMALLLSILALVGLRRRA